MAVQYTLEEQLYNTGRQQIARGGQLPCPKEKQMTRFGLFISCRCHCIKSCQLLPSVITAVQALTKSPVGHPSHTEPPQSPPPHWLPSSSASPVLASAATACSSCQALRRS